MVRYVEALPGSAGRPGAPTAACRLPRGNAIPGVLVDDSSWPFTWGRYWVAGTWVLRQRRQASSCLRARGPRRAAPWPYEDGSGDTSLGRFLPDRIIRAGGHRARNGPWCVRCASMASTHAQRWAWPLLYTPTRGVRNAGTEIGLRQKNWQRCCNLSLTGRARLGNKTRGWG
jgi:hypothetical protein